MRREEKKHADIELANQTNQRKPCAHPAGENKVIETRVQSSEREREKKIRTPKFCCIDASETKNTHLWQRWSRTGCWQIIRSRLAPSSSTLDCLFVSTTTRLRWDALLPEPFFPEETNRIEVCVCVKQNTETDRDWTQLSRILRRESKQKQCTKKNK